MKTRQYPDYNPTPGHLLHLIKQAFRSALTNTAENKNNKERSREWIKQLSAQFEKDSASENIAVFRVTDKAKRFKRGAKNRSEFLFDILVAATGNCPTPVHTEKEDLEMIICPLLQVESEFSENTGDSIEDMSKLVCGRAGVSIFVGPLGERGPDNYLEIAKQIAPHIEGSFFCAFVQHPRYWNATSPDPQLFQWINRAWQPITN